MRTAASWAAWEKVCRQRCAAQPGSWTLCDTAVELSAKLFHEHIALRLDSETTREFGPAGLAS